MQEFQKPKHLCRGDAVAVLSSSWGGPSVFPHVYERGIEHLSKEFGLTVVEYPTTRMSAKELYASPQLRAKDVNDAFADKNIKGVISSIGGDDSIRVLPYLDRDCIGANPKIVMGYSDTSTLLTYCNQLGLVTFNGPSVMAGFSQLSALPKEFVTHIKTLLFECPDAYEYLPYSDGYYEGYPDWSNVENVGLLKDRHSREDWHWLQGDSIVRGRLFGGCLEVLEFFLKGTAYWPKSEFWNEKILFLETSEEKPTVATVKYMLRGFGTLGILDRIAGLIFGRARGYTFEEKERLDAAITAVVSKEFGRTELPIVTNMDFGHTDPQWILPLGIMAEIDCAGKAFRLTEAPCA